MKMLPMSGTKMPAWSSSEDHASNSHSLILFIWKILQTCRELKSMQNAVTCLGLLHRHLSSKVDSNSIRRKSDFSAHQTILQNESRDQQNETNRHTGIGSAMAASWRNSDGAKHDDYFADYGRTWKFRWFSSINRSINQRHRHRPQLQRLLVEFLENGLSEDHEILNTYRGQSASKICWIWWHYLLTVGCKMQSNTVQNCVKRIRPAKESNNSPTV